MSVKVVVITGASSGIGAALAEHLARTTDYQLVLVARRKDALDAVAARCDGKAAVVVADVEKRNEVRTVSDYVLRQLNRIDVWVNNAGRGISRPPSQLTDDDVDAMMRINVKSALYGMQEVLPHFKSRGEGHFINISSMLARIPHAVIRSAYSASKFYLNALTAMMRDEVRQTHPDIVFSLVSPSVVVTEFGSNSVHGGPDSRLLQDGQEAREVAAVIAGVIQSRAPDVYTRKGSRDRVAAHYASIGVDP
ncbi:MAG: SDR family NAD(P)-dependent oxidoreductase [Gemmatimonadota bacterium]